MKNSQTSPNHWNAEDYSTNSSIQYRYAIRLLNQYSFESHEHILDIGCGDGKITALMAESIPHGQILGIDSSPAMITYAKKFEKSLKNISFHQQDATQLNFTEKFNWVTSFSCLQWVEDQQAAWEGIYQALVPGGKAMVLFYRKLNKVWQAIDELVALSEWKSFLTNYHPPVVHAPLYEKMDQTDYCRMLENIGLQVDYSEEGTELCFFENKNVFERFVAGWMPYLLKIPMEKQAAFMSQFGTLYLKLVPAESSGAVKMYVPHRTFVVTKRA